MALIWSMRPASDRWKMRQQCMPWSKKKKKKNLFAKFKAFNRINSAGSTPLLYGMMISLHNLRRLINSQYLPNFFFSFFNFGAWFFSVAFSRLKVIKFKIKFQFCWYSHPFLFLFFYNFIVLIQDRSFLFRFNSI